SVVAMVSSYLVSAIGGVRPAGRLGAELLRVLRGQSLPAAKLERVPGDDAADGLARKKPIEHVEADVPAGGAPREVAAIDVVPEREPRAAAERIELPAEVIAAPAVLEQLRRLGSLDAARVDLRRSGRGELHRAHGRQAPIGIERRPLG